MINTRGQTITPEFVIIFFLAIAAIVGTSVYAQRGLQARIRDARIYMVNMATSGCQAASGANCQGLGTAARFNYEYETYYTQQQAEVQRRSSENKILNTTNTIRQSFQQTVTHSRSEQRPPWDAD